MQRQRRSTSNKYVRPPSSGKSAVGQPLEASVVDRLRKWLANPGGKVWAVILVMLSAVLGGITTLLLTSSPEPQSPSAVGIMALDDPGDNVRDMYDSDISGTNGLSANTIFENTTGRTITVVSMRAELAGKSYPTHYATSGNCTGRSFDLRPGIKTAIEYFIDDLPGESIMEAASDGNKLVLIVTDISGKDWPIAAASAGNSDSDMQLIDLSDECRYTFIPGGA